MDMAIFTFVFLCCIHVGYTSKLIVILMDGFRWDYFDHVDMPGFAKMAKEGVKVDYLQPDYPSLSYPNYYSIMTGNIIKTYLCFYYSPILFYFQNYHKKRGGGSPYKSYIKMQICYKVSAIKL